jgi:cation transport ATPase
MAGNDKEQERLIPTNGWSEWRYYVLEKLKDQQETIEVLRKENTDLQLNMHLMREQKLEKRHEDLKRRVQALTDTADALNAAVAQLKEERKEMQAERREKRRDGKKLWLAIIQGFAAILIALLSFLGKACSGEEPTKAPVAPAASTAEPR